LHLNLFLIHLAHCFATTKNYFKNVKVIGKRCIPKAFMTPWVGNLISNSPIKKITTLAKPHGFP
jgi:hypothetical protein